MVINNIVNKIVIFSLLTLLTLGCIPPREREIREVRIDLNDPQYRKIINFQDEQLIDSLYQYLRHADPSYRYASAMAFASIKTEASKDSLLTLLKDPIPKVRTSAAFALGQLGLSSIQDSLISAFNGVDTLPPNNELNATILGAIGRCGDEQSLSSIATVSTYRPTDTLLLYGQAKAIYNYALRDICIKEGTERMADFVSSDIYPDNVRLVAANYMKRAKNIDLSPFKFRLNKAYLAEDNDYLKMDMAIALGKAGGQEILRTLLNELNNNVDYRIKVNIIRSLGNFTYIDVVEDIIEQLQNPNVQIARTAAQFLVDQGQPNDVIIYRRHGKEDLPWQVKSKIYEAIIKHVPAYFSKTKGASLWDIRKQIESSSNSYEKAAYIKALSHDFSTLPYLKQLGFSSNEFPVRTAAIEALNTIISREDLESSMTRYRFRQFKKEVAELLLQAFESEDTGMIALAAMGFMNCSFDLKEEYENLDFIQSVKNKLTLPVDVESYNELLKLESHLSGENFEAVKIEHDHKIDWKIFDALGTGAKAVIETEKGSFEMEFMKNNAPGSTVNFVQLAEKGYFEGKRFHRVVPNFVVQTGCSRGDGWGSLEYTIRSELSLMSYDREGMVGMASAGNHTESSQWFVTHSPTLHLDGNYTIFAQISTGMDIIHDIEIGDVIQSVKIQY